MRQGKFNLIKVEVDGNSVTHKLVKTGTVESLLKERPDTPEWFVSTLTPGGNSVVVFSWCDEFKRWKKV